MIETEITHAILIISIYDFNAYVKKKKDFIMWNGFGDAPSKQVYY